MRRLALLLGLGLEGLLLAATSPVLRAAGGVQTQVDSEVGFDNVTILDASVLGDKVSVTRVGSDRTNTNLLSIFADLKNLTAHALTIQAQTLYKDGDGNWLDGGKAGWVTLTLKPHEELEYRSASLSVDAQDFLVRVRVPPKPPQLP